MSAQVLQPRQFAARWRYRFIQGMIFRYWSAHDRPPQVWRNKVWEDVVPPKPPTHPEHPTPQ